jgi:PAS domain S-box-containing protein
MFKIFAKLIFFIFIAVAIAILILFFSRETEESLLARYKSDARTTSIITGRFVGHVLNERLGKLRDVAAEKTKVNRVVQLGKYTKYVREFYGHSDSIALGILNSGFEIESSIDYGDNICSEENLVNDIIKKRLLVGKAYIGPITPGCSAQIEKTKLNFIMIVPIMDDKGFNGAVFEISPVIENMHGFSIGLKKNIFGSVSLLVDDPGYNEPDSEAAELLTLKDSLGIDNVALYKDRVVGFYSFFLEDMKLCLVYETEKVRKRFAPECCPWLQDYSVIIFISPAILLILMVLFEILNVNKKLGKEVQVRTRHLDDMKKRYESLFQTIPEYVVIYNNEGDILESNERFKKLFTNIDIVGANIIYFIREKDRFREKLENMSGDRVEYFGEYIFFSGLKEPMTVSVNSIKTDVDGKDAVLSVFTDLTEYKDMQNKFYSDQQGEAVGTLAAGMAHDFSNILQNVSLQYNLAQRAKNPEKKDEHINNIKNAIEGAQKYLKSVLSYTKGRKSEYVEMPGYDFIEKALALVERILPAEVEVRYTDNSQGIKIRADEGRFLQMIVNLCQNASDAMFKSGIIYINADVEEKPFGRFLRLSVKDRGRGIHPEVLDRIFKPFYTTKEGKGTGLGLATVKQVVMNSGGFIEVKSELGEGTEFIILFPESK